LSSSACPERLVSLAASCGRVGFHHIAEEAAVKYDRFEDLPVWKAASEVADRIYAITKDCAFRQPGDLLDQLRRAALSISNNIAEGFESGTTSGLVAYLYIARGSSGEVRSMLRVCERLPEMGHLNQQIAQLIVLTESCSRQLRGWAESLQNSDIRGQRHLNERTRRAYESRHRSNAFLAKLDEDQRKRLAQRQYAAPPERRVDEETQASSTDE
jgi:four helix bundle protein